MIINNNYRWIDDFRGKNRSSTVPLIQFGGFLMGTLYFSFYYYKTRTSLCQFFFSIFLMSCWLRWHKTYGRFEDFRLNWFHELLGPVDLFVQSYFLSVVVHVPWEFSVLFKIHVLVSLYWSYIGWFSLVPDLNTIWPKTRNNCLVY